MLNALSNVRMSALCAALPAQRAANATKIAETTGILERRVAAPGATVVDLCVRAAEKALADAKAKPDDFGAIVFVSFTQHCRMPSGAAQAQARLGFPRDVLAFDVSLACSGWAYGLYLAGLLARETAKKVLLLDGDVQSAFLNRQDENTVSLFSDGGTAAIVEKGEASWTFSFATDGEKGDALKLEEGGTIAMDGFKVFKFVATDVVRYVKDFLSSLPAPHSSLPTPHSSLLTSHSSLLTSHSSLVFVPHQPNVYMVRQLAKSVGFDETHTAVSCDRFGNLASASIPVTIAANNVRGPVLLAGFGGGLSVSVALIDVLETCKLSLIEE